MSKKDLLLRELRTIEKKYGFLDAREVVNVARDPKNIMHDYFEWDDKKASEEYRIHQSRNLINSVKIEIEGRQVTGFWSAKVVIGDVKSRRYYGVEKVLSDKKIRDSVLSLLIAEVTGIQNKYAELEETSRIINKKELKKLSKKVK